jgi:hypothetical protein
MKFSKTAIFNLPVSQRRDAIMNITNRDLGKKSVIKTLFALLMLATLSNPAFALVSCEIEVQLPGGDWESAEFAGRGDTFGNDTVSTLDDGDTCRRNGRLIGPDLCHDRGGLQFRIIADKNSGPNRVWYEQC